MVFSHLSPDADDMRAAPRKALLVDGPDDRRVFRRFLQLHGFEIRECDTLEEAIPMVSDFQPDLLVTELARALGRCRGEVERLPILFHGNRQTDWDRSSSEVRNVGGFLVRPFSLLDFHLSIQGLLRS